MDGHCALSLIGSEEWTECAGDRTRDKYPERNRTVSSPDTIARRRAPSAGSAGPAGSA
ncbi:hypothetical protein VARIO8X_120350 [Burkholderiales bacterium 8X]|nr:hypothetical protein VARIO8X_120350 [Burkholderiales bacterium 8X]